MLAHTERKREMRLPWSAESAPSSSLYLLVRLPHFFSNAATFLGVTRLSLKKLGSDCRRVGIVARATHARLFRRGAGRTARTREEVRL